MVHECDHGRHRVQVAQASVGPQHVGKLRRGGHLNSSPHRVHAQLRKPPAEHPLPARHVQDSLARSGLRLDPTAVAGLLAEARGHAERVALEAEQLALVEDTGRPVLLLPYLSDGVDSTAVAELAEILTDQGMV